MGQDFLKCAKYEAACTYGIYLTIDILYPLEHWPDLFQGRQILTRLDPGQGYGHINTFAPPAIFRNLVFRRHNSGA